MTPLTVGLALIVLMLVVHRWTEANALAPERPLDVDEGLPFPDLAQASSIFSLTALYTAYVTMTVVLGAAALFGLAVGGIVALIGMRRVVERADDARGFEDFIVSHIVSSESGRAVLYIVVVAQIGFAASELVILRESAIIGFHMAPRHATVLMLSLVVVPYYYCLVGGYRALFRTDVIQFVAIGIMCAYIGAVAVSTLIATPRSVAWLRPNQAWWNFGLATLLAQPFAEWLIAGVHVGIGCIMGASFMVASPDTWKRVFVAVRMRPSAHTFWRLVGAGALPFVAILPVLALLPRPRESEFLPIAVFFQSGPVRNVDMVLVFGIIATFLSSFAGASLSAAHLLLLERRIRREQPVEMPRFQILLGGVTLVTVFVALAFVEGNPYFIGHLLLGLYGIVAGAIVGAAGRPARSPRWFATAVAVLTLSWLMFLAGDRAVVQTPKLSQMNAVPVAVVFFIATATVAAIALKDARRGAR